MSKPKIAVIVGSTRAARLRRQADGMDRQHSQKPAAISMSRLSTCATTRCPSSTRPLLPLGALQERGCAALAEEGRRVRRLHRDRSRIQAVVPPRF